MKKSTLTLVFTTSLLLAAKKHVPQIPRKVQVDKSAASYTVQQGDWLSSIAENYFGNQKDWEKIAKKNPEIKNPDLIHPGDVISFEALDQMRETATISQDLPTLVKLEKTETPKAVDLEQPFIKDGHTDIKVRVKHFILGQEEVLGEISGSTEERKFFLSGDRIFIKSRDLSKFKVGERLSVAKMVGDLEDRTVSKSLNLGELVELVGDVEVLEWGEKFVKCEVNSVFGKIERGDKIVPLIPAVRLGEKIKPPTDLLLKVVMAEDMGAKLSSQGSLILLNKGWQSSVAPDQYFRVFSDMDPVHDTPKKVEPESKGEVQIVYAGKTASIGLITKAQRPIELGDALVPYQHFSDPKPPPHKEIETIEIN